MDYDAFGSSRTKGGGSRFRTLFIAGQKDDMAAIERLGNLGSRIADTRRLNVSVYRARRERRARNLAGVTSHVFSDRTCHEMASLHQHLAGGSIRKLFTESAMPLVMSQRVDRVA